MCWQEAASRRGVSIVSSLPRRTEFWNLRDYGTGTWEGGNDPACDHVKFAAPRAERPDCGMTGGKDTVDAGNAPYRTTCGKCGARRIDRQLGLEPQVDCSSLGQAQCGQCYVCQQVRVFRLVRTAMANHAVAFVNIGDSYSSGNRTTQFDPANSKRSTLQGGTPGMAGNPVRPPPDPGIPAGNLCLIPQRLALALQRDGWIVRSVIVWCLSPSTVLYAKTATTEGPMDVHDLVRLDPSTVKLWTGQKWSQVLGWSETETAGDTMKITLRSGESFICTAGHRWPLADGRVVRADELQCGSDLFDGDVLATCQLPEPEVTEGDELEDLAWFAGLYLAEGSISDDCISLAGHTAEVERHERVASIARKYGGSATLTSEGDTATQRVHGN